ncbi:MAG TPA: hypothetical protein PLC76_03760 [Saprospiraceae bacterium]|jgi:amino acid permease|nr:MAG: hypothetical protein UZ08_BCD001001330 [Candidatus Parvibacillus calidus]MBX2937759.1 hypothetical protein [Saprospiraceae bacterium]MBX7178157.1 hypothetical protein [Saprospiraceae bacterium]MCB0590490.1 hypothetical protein [Saprospiraceae bacterium]MCO5281994.1 hypothetical protein [Saprospiraceae bacterium]
MKANQPFFTKDSLILGVVIGTVVPIVLYALILMLKDALVSAGIVPELFGEFRSSQRTIGIIALCGNLIVIHYFNNRRFGNAMRGLIFPTFAYVCWWVWEYGPELLDKF